MIAERPPHIVDEAELLKLTHYKSRGHLEKWLVNNRIKYFRAKAGKLFTTVGLMEAAKNPHHAGPEPIVPFEF